MIPISLAVIVAELLISGCSARSTMPPAGTSGGPADSVHYVVVRGGRIASRTSTWTDRSGTTIVRTRSPSDTGPAVVTQLRFEPRSGAPVWLHTTGVDASGRAVEERFETAGGVASWESSSESGRKEAAPERSISRWLTQNGMRSFRDCCGLRVRSRSYRAAEPGWSAKARSSSRTEPRGSK